eukprot:15345808-Ditylum_brightwellii.AAC.1
MDNWTEEDFLQHNSYPNVLYLDLLAKSSVSGVTKTPSLPHSPNRIHEIIKEHTSALPFQAASFQLTLLVFKTLGSHINNMYTTLELICIVFLTTLVRTCSSSTPL